MADQYQPPRLLDETTPCTVCKLSFPSSTAFEQHKLSSPDHICCDVCLMDFHSMGAMKQHHDLLHPAEQDLVCGCGQIFHRLGGLIFHMESGTCPVVTKAAFENKSKQKLEVQAVMSTLKRSENQRTPVTATFPPNQQPQSAHVASPQPQSPLPSPKGPHFEFDELISWDVPSSILNAPWGAQQVAHKNIDESTMLNLLSLDDGTAFPALSSESANIIKRTASPNPDAANAVASPWSTNNIEAVTVPMPFSENLVDAPFVAAGPSPSVSSPEPASPWSTPEGTALPIPDVQWDLRDPDNPAFNMDSFWLPFLLKYKCPYGACAKSFASATSFIAHLKSAAHRDSKLQCHSCLRYFASATALTQHLEAQGVRCKAREKSHFGAFIDTVTGGTAEVQGLHADKTHKFAVTHMLTAMANDGLAKAHRNKGVELDTKKNQYWAANKPRW